ncbi:transcriptional regulator [Photorhabdus luminescens]|uniref:Transcriptional regulator n=1 Tax=Photorhabdus akhurstii TaxID=171438 RepID=A0ABX8M4K7_9GAMM|nr:GNAT family N-acetyltransferase [Photorhabdus akhurstii]QXF35814.1 transcriptional regulator [Photorhabdus akhurstii]UJD77646.1 transcriptional regulator [Photorhabdus luminescens]
MSIFNPTLFEKSLPEIGSFALRPLDLERDIPILTDWVNRDYAHYWGMKDNTEQQVWEFYHDLESRHPGSVFIGIYQEQPAFLLECYRAQDDLIGKYYPAHPDDMGMHILVAPPQEKIKNFTWGIFQTIIAFIFSDPAVVRIVVEPNIHNEKIHKLNLRAGFVYQKALVLPHKTAKLAFCTREQHQIALQREYQATTSTPPGSLVTNATHLQPAVWQKVNRLHLCKAISEFSHECLLAPQQLTEKADSDGYHHYRLDSYRLNSADLLVSYTFRARRMALDHWLIDANSLQKHANGEAVELDSLLFIIEFKQQLGISDVVMPTYLEEITSTLYSSAFKHNRIGISAMDLVNTDFQELEGEMMEGHPSFVANNGRIGFDIGDFQNFSPEAASVMHLVWLAAHKSQAHFACIEQLNYQQLLEQELGTTTVADFDQRLIALNLNPKDYFLMPVHPWQWQNKLASIFAPDIANQKLVYLGIGTDAYQAQQSIRTLFNRTHPQRYYVKMALSILNMGFMRGLSPYYMATTPGINDWLFDLVTQDPILQRYRFKILREVASVGFKNSYYEQAISSDTPYKKMMAALWRENPLQLIEPGQQVMTMAALLHSDQQGNALLPALISASDLSTQEWLRRYLESYLAPLLHCLYAYDLMFMPHGENIIMVLENHVPQHIFMKDLAEEILVMNPDADLPEKASRVKVDMPEDMKTLTILSDVFDGIFRYLAAILDEQGSYSQDLFWQSVADCILSYQHNHPELREQFVRYDLFTPEIKRCCLNRLQIANNRQMLDLADPAQSLQFADNLINPIAKFGHS